MEQKFHGNKKVTEGGEAMFKQRGKEKNSSQRKTIFGLKEFFELPGSRDQKRAPWRFQESVLIPKTHVWPYRPEKLVIYTEQKLRPA